MQKKQKKQKQFGNKCINKTKNTINKKQNRKYMHLKKNQTTKIGNQCIHKTKNNNKPKA
jgi:hypothetical protein